MPLYVVNRRFFNGGGITSAVAGQAGVGAASPGGAGRGSARPATALVAPQGSNPSISKTGGAGAGTAGVSAAAYAGAPASGVLRGGPSNTGHTNHPSWTGSFTGGTNTTGFTATSGNTYNFWDFRGGVDVGTTSTAANNVTFNGCRFQFSANTSNQGNNSAAQCLLFGDNVTFNYCTFQPSTTNYPTRLTGEEVEADRTTYVEYGKAYQYAIVGGGGYNTHIDELLINHCDFWGFGNAIELAGSTTSNRHVVQYSWFHHGGDPFVENNTANQFHNDCWLVNNGGYHGAKLLYSTMEIWGNTNCLAWQGTGAYNDSEIVGNLFGGDQQTISLSASGTSQRITFTDNVFATRIGRAVGDGRPLRGWSVSDSGSGSTWRRNTWQIDSGEASSNYPGAKWGTPSKNGQYWWPGDSDTSYGHATEYTG